MIRYKTVGAAAVLFGLITCIGSTMFYAKKHQSDNRTVYENPLEAAPREENPLAHIDENFIADENFTSHLPIIILDMGGEEPPVSTYADAETGIFYPIEGLDPYVDGNITILNKETGVNSLQDAPTEKSNISIKRRGNSSMLYKKPQYLVKLVTNSGQDNDRNLLGMGAEHEWVLNGSMIDKSMLRNYLVYSIASEIMPYTPESVFCEVLIKKDGKYHYQGEYLLMEKIGQGPDRVAISDYQAGETFNSYIIRRDRIDESGTMLHTYARENGFAEEYFGLVYPGKTKVTETMISYVETDINRFEKVIYSDTLEVFSSYKNLIDVDSFLDYFLINEFFGSYDAGNFSTYSYKEKGGKLQMGPIWDLDGAIDNYKFEPLDTEKIAFQTKPWFAQLCEDDWFVTELEKRYIQLRRTSLSEEHVMGTIDEIVTHLGGVIDREWYRWGGIYTTENKYSILPYEMESGDILKKNMVTHEQELYKIKTAIRDHGEAIPDYLKLLHKSTAVTTDASSKSGIWLFFALAAFMIPAFYVAKRS